MKKKGNKKMPTPRQKVINNPIPTSLFCSKLLAFFVYSYAEREKTIIQKSTIPTDIQIPT